jgi:hypothetical protein
MSETSHLNRIPVSKETGFLKRKWRSILFFFHRSAFESKLEGILRATAGHEGNSVPPGDPQYQLLSTEADSLCTELANRWGLNVELLRARIAGLAKLKRLSVPSQTMNYSRLAWLGMLAMPVLCLLAGAAAGLVNLGFHLVGGR